MSKPRVHGLLSGPIDATGIRWDLAEYQWMVDFTDTCGCEEESIFPTWSRAMTFANSIAAGVDRWHA